MLSQLINLSLRYRGIAPLLILILVVVGILSFQSLPFDAFPDTTPVQVTINTVAPALAPLEVERQITAPLEQATSGLPGLEEVRSVSKFGFSQLTVTFSDDTDIYLARQVISERLAAIELPDGVGQPSLGPVSTGLGEVFQYVLESENLDAQELRTLHHWVIRPQMLQVPGVAEINTWGGFEKQYHVIINPEKLLKYELSLDDVAAALKRNNANVGGGQVGAGGGESMIVQGIGIATSKKELEQIVIAAVDGKAIKIKDVAKIDDEGFEIRRGAATSQGKGETVLGLGFMLMGENSRVVTKKLEERLKEVQASLPEGTTIKQVYSRTDLVDRVLLTVRDNLLEGALFVVAVLFIFLGHLRAGLIVALAIPLSMLFAFSAMLKFGIAGSLMSLGAIDFGLVVDSSVIMVENAAKHVAEDRSDRSVREIVREAAIEVREPTMFGELIIAIVYLPVLTLEGVEGKLFRPMALTVIFALLGSMFLSLTLMPALASMVLSKPKKTGGHTENFFVRVLAWLYRPVLWLALKLRPMVVLGAICVIGAAVWVSGQLGSEFIPRLKEQALVVNTVRLAGVSLEESVRYGTLLELHLLNQFPDEIESIWTRTGTAEVATDPMGLEVSDVFITLKPMEGWSKATNQDELMAAMSESIEHMPGMNAAFAQPIELRMNEMTAGIRADLGIKLFGDDFEILKQKAGEIEAIVSTIPGATDVSVEQLTGAPILRIEMNHDALARFDIPKEEILERVEALGAIHIGDVVEGQMRFDLVMRLEDRFRDDPEVFGRLLITTASGQRVPISQLTKITRVEGPSTVNREWAKRRAVVQVNVRDRDVGSFVAEARQRIHDEVKLEPGYFVRYGGQFENLERAQNRLLLVVPLALMLIFALLYISLKSVRDAALVFTGVPFAVAGGVFALYARGIPFSISAGVGFIAVSGVSVLGQLVLVSRIQQLLAEGFQRLQAVKEAAQTRLRPVLMTASVAALGFMPMALNAGMGAEVQRPLATVVVGGVFTSTTATLILLPALYALFGTKPQQPASPTASNSPDTSALESVPGVVEPLQPEPLQPEPPKLEQIQAEFVDQKPE